MIDLNLKILRWFLDLETSGFSGVSRIVVCANKIKDSVVCLESHNLIKIPIGFLDEILVFL